jgi:hypothetical protein
LLTVVLHWSHVEPDKVLVLKLFGGRAAGG